MPEARNLTKYGVQVRPFWWSAANSVISTGIFFSVKNLESMPTILLKTAEDDESVLELTNCYFYIPFDLAEFLSPLLTQ